MLKRILIAYDGSETGLKAAKVGIDLAKIYGAEVLVVYAADTKILDQMGDILLFPGAKEKIEKMMEEQGKEATGKISKLASDAGLRCQEIVEEGDPSSELLKVSERNGADLVVIGSTGKTALGRALLGSVAERMVHHSKVPVMVVPGNEAD